MPHIHKQWHLWLLAGLIGGLAEVIWVIVFSLWHGTDGWIVARGVTTALFSSENKSMYGYAALGIAIHMLLSVLLAFALSPLFKIFWRRPRSKLSTLSVALAALASVWMINFHLILPELDPAFVQLIPYYASLMSKLLFGVGFAMVLFLIPNKKSRIRTNNNVKCIRS